MNNLKRSEKDKLWRAFVQRIWLNRDENISSNGRSITIVVYERKAEENV